MIDERELRKSIALNVARLRQDRGWSQGELAERLQVSRIHINRIENAKSSVSAELLYSLADAFGVPSDTLRLTTSAKHPSAA